MKGREKAVCVEVDVECRGKERPRGRAGMTPGNLLRADVAIKEGCGAEDLARIMSGE